jgi:phage terminase small subunit
LRVEPVNTKVETPSDPVQPKEYDSLDFLRTCMRDPSLDEKQRIRAAIALAQYEHVKRADGGKKDAVKDAAEKASGSKFAPSAPPLKLVNTH